MFNLDRQIPFVASPRRNLIVGFILCVYLCFFIIVLEPFDTSQFENENKTLLMAGYGILIFFVYVIQGFCENVVYRRIGKVWTLRREVVSTIIFCLFAGTILYIYNRLVVNLTNLSLATYWRFLSFTVLCMLPVFIPPMLYLRKRFGERIVPPAQNEIRLTGENRNEILQMDKRDLLFVKAVENYVEICFVDEGQIVSKTFRQTLTSVSMQLPFLQKCHRSYLVNPSSIKTIEGNSQAAQIVFGIGKQIPLSKTYYKQLKTVVV